MDIISLVIGSSIVVFCFLFICFLDFIHTQHVNKKTKQMINTINKYGKNSCQVALLYIDNKEDDEIRERFDIILRKETSKEESDW